MACRLSRLALFLLATPAVAQYGTTGPDVQPNNYPPALPARRTPGPVLTFERIGEIALPGPLAASPAWIAGGLVSVPVQGGVATVAPDLGAEVTTDPGAKVGERSEWVASPDGKRRYRSTAEGRIEAERRSKSRRGWSRSWRLRTPNSIQAPPILIGPRLCFAGLDDRVTCVRAKNGHRLWSVDLGDRLSKPLAVWPAGADEGGDRSILLAVPDDGATVTALDAYDGRKVATYELPAQHHFVSPALVASGDRIALTRKGYDDNEAALVLLRLVPPPPPTRPAPVSYNGASDEESEPSGR
jgi:hypothetical protein